MSIALGIRIRDGQRAELLPGTERDGIYVGFLVGNLKTNYPNLEYGTFEIPTVSEEVPYAYYRYNGESTPGIKQKCISGSEGGSAGFHPLFLGK